MLKNKIKRLFFAPGKENKILSGPAAGMKVRYDVANRSQHLLGIYEREIYPYIEKGIKEKELLIDVGANDGYYLLAFVKSGKKVIACEPGPIVDQLVANAALNNFVEGRHFNLEKRLVGSSNDPSFVTIGQLAKGAKNSFILVDIDGGEVDLLHSCGANFPHDSTSWVIEVHSKNLEQQCIDFLANHNYKVKVIKNAWWRRLVPEQRPLELNRWLYAEPK